MNLNSEISLSVLFLVKWGLTAFLVIYAVFALVVAKQIKVMNATLDVGFEGPLVVLALAHVAFAIFVLFLAIFLL